MQSLALQKACLCCLSTVNIAHVLDVHILTGVHTSLELVSLITSTSSDPNVSMMSVRLFLLVSSTFCPNLTAAPPVTSFKPAPRPTPTVSFDWRQSKLLQTYSVSMKDNTHSSVVPVPVSVSDPQCPKHLLVLSHLRVHTSLRCLIQPTSSCYL